MSLTTSGSPAPKFFTELTEVGEAIMPYDARRPRRGPVTPDGEAVLVLVHVGVGTDRKVEVLAQQAGCGH